MKNNVSKKQNHVRRKPVILKKLETVVLQEFSSKAYHEVEMRTIAKKSGVSLGTIYKYYGSKEKLLFSFVNDWLNELSDRYVDHLQGIEDIKERLRKVLWVGLDFYERNRELGKIMFVTIPEKIWMEDKNYRQKKLTDIFTGVLKEGQQKGYLNPNVLPGLILDLFGGLHRGHSKCGFTGTKKMACQKRPMFYLILSGMESQFRKISIEGCPSLDSPNKAES